MDLAGWPFCPRSRCSRVAGIGTPRGRKKTRRVSGGFEESENERCLAGEDFRNLGFDFYRARMIAFHAVKLMAALEHSVEFIDQQGDRFVALIRLDRGIEVRALNLDVTFRRELDSGRVSAIAFQLHAEAHDALLVSEQSFGFLAHERLERRCEFEVNARDDYFVVVLAVHVSAFCFG